MKAATLFTGGGGVDLALRNLGVDVVWGIEKSEEIAAAAGVNGIHAEVRDILSADTREYEPVDILHASPPCPNFSTAKQGAMETPADINMARKVAAFVRTLKPRIFTLENVYYYRKSRSFALILSTLNALGYFHHYSNVNAADYGVPQTRRRLILRAVRHGLVASLPTPEPWRGWYGAIEDIIPQLPDSEFAPWQLKRLSGNLGTFLLSTVNADGTTKPRQKDSPAFTVQATANRNMPRAFVMDGQYGAMGTDGERSPTTRYADEPVFTITATQTKRFVRAMLKTGRVVAMTPRALARFQTFPDDYELPRNNRVACRIIGNAVPPMLYEKIVGVML